MKFILPLIIASLMSLPVSAETKVPRYYALVAIAKAEVDRDLVRAKELAEELLDLSSTEPKD